MESLSAKVYAEPPTIEKLSDLFQTFYIKASSHISTHIATLALRIERESRSSRDVAGTSLAKQAKQPARRPSKESIASLESSSEHQMLTVSEVTEKKKARKLLEYKRLALEEAIERRACESIYAKIWRHQSTLDDVRDEKLRSKTAALALVGIGMKDLGIDVEQHSDSSRGEDDFQTRLAPAREELARMTGEKSPLGKLQRLTTAHKTIVDTLSAIHSASSSADEILPTLIYTLVTSPPEGINVISNLAFIERFRTASKMDGEAAYCMTNLEAAIVFLENVDLASLREDEVPQGPPKSPSRPASQTTVRSSENSPTDSVSEKRPRSPVAAVTFANVPTTSTTSITSTTAQAMPASTRQATSAHQRRLSNLLNPPAKALGAANDKVRNTAEEGLKNISSTLDSSFKFLFGRLREHSIDDSQPTMPQTLEEARKLVGQPMVGEDGACSDTSSVVEKEFEERPKREDRLVSMVAGGRRQGPHSRDRSIDSVRSSGSSSRRRVASSAVVSSNNGNSMAGPSTPNALETVKSFGSHLGSAFGGSFKVLGRATPTPPAVNTDKEPAKKVLSDETMSKNPDVAIAPIKGPIERFLQMEDAADLTVRDVSLLLRDYQRLASIVQGVNQT